MPKAPGGSAALQGELWGPRAAAPLLVAFAQTLSGKSLASRVVPWKLCPLYSTSKLKDGPLLTAFPIPGMESGPGRGLQVRPYGCPHAHPLL